MALQILPENACIRLYRLHFPVKTGSDSMAIYMLSQVISVAPLLGGMYGTANTLISKTIECPPELIGLLIGKKGWTMKTYQSDSGAQIAVNQSVRAGRNRKFIVSGDRCGVEVAIRMIQNSVMTKSRRGEQHHVNQIRIAHSNYHLVDRRHELEIFRARNNVESSPLVPAARNARGRP